MKHQNLELPQKDHFVERKSQRPTPLLETMLRWNSFLIIVKTRLALKYLTLATSPIVKTRNQLRNAKNWKRKENARRRVSRRNAKRLAKNVEFDKTLISVWILIWINLKNGYGQIDANLYLTWCKSLELCRHHFIPYFLI